MEFRPHISLDVANLDAAVKFYAAVFDAEPTKRYADYANFRLESPAIHLALVHQQGRTPTQNSNEHFGIELFDPTALEAWQKRVEAAGLLPRIERAITCCYAVGDKFWLADPDGHQWEFWVRSEEADAMHGLSASEPACCAPVPLPALSAKSSCCG